MINSYHLINISVKNEYQVHVLSPIYTKTIIGSISGYATTVEIMSANSTTVKKAEKKYLKIVQIAKSVD